MNKNLNGKINKALDGCNETVWVYLKASNDLGANFDPYRNTGYVETFQSPIPIKAVAVHQLSGSGLVAKELGLSLTGAIEIIVNDTDKELIKNASKLKYNNQFYTTYHEALGARTLEMSRPFGMTKFTCFLQGNS